VPLSCKERTIVDGIVYTRCLGLSAIEIRFARSFVGEEEARDIKLVAEKTDVALYVHSPYYINLAGNKETVEASMEKIKKTLVIGHHMGARVATTHLGFYGGLSKKETMRRIAGRVRELRDWALEQNIAVSLGLETMGKKDVFGSLDEIVSVCQRVRGTVPVLDIGHIYARGLGSLKEKEDFQRVFDAVEPLGISHHLIHLTGVKYDNDGEMYHLPLKKGDLPVLKLMECILENDYDVTIISESPVVEHDAVYAQILLDRAMELMK
jgi:deoxyribonuclease-4